MKSSIERFDEGRYWSHDSAAGSRSSRHRCAPTCPSSDENSASLSQNNTFGIAVRVQQHANHAVVHNVLESGRSLASAYEAQPTAPGGLRSSMWSCSPGSSLLNTPPTGSIERAQPLLSEHIILQHPSRHYRAH